MRSTYNRSKHTHTCKNTHTFGVTGEDTLEMVPSGGFPANAEDNVGVFFTFNHHKKHTNIQTHTPTQCSTFTVKVGKKL